jgi:hypothetical protein
LALAHDQGSLNRIVLQSIVRCVAIQVFTEEFYVTNAAQLGFSLSEHPFLCNAAQHAALHCLSAFSVNAFQIAELTYDSSKWFVFFKNQ